MIRLFRNIRHQFIRQGQISKYLIYALGEILLVVLGIIIALQIDNWNENRKDKANEKALYVKILDDLVDQYYNITARISSMKSYQDVHYQVFNQINGYLSPDSNKYYNSLEWVFPYHLDITEKYADLLIDIKNDSIRNLLKSVIHNEKSVQDAYGEWNKLKVERVRPFFNKHGIHNTEGVFNDDPYTFFPGITKVKLIDYEQLRKQYGSQELNELLFDLRFKTSWIFARLKYLKGANIKLEQALIESLVKAGMKDKIKRINPKKLLLSDQNEKSIDKIIEIIKKQEGNDQTYDKSEESLNQFGYALMEVGRNEDALKIFTLNTELYPRSFNVFDSYGECLLKLGEKEKAKEAYKKSLEILPNNNNASKILDEMGY